MATFDKTFMNLPICRSGLVYPLPLQLFWNSHSSGFAKNAFALNGQSELISSGCSVLPNIRRIWQRHTNTMMTIREISKRLRCSLSTVYELVDAGTLESFRIGPNRGTIRVSEEQLKTYLNANRSLPRSDSGQAAPLVLDKSKASCELP